MGIKNKIKDKVLDVMERVQEKIYPNNMKEEDYYDYSEPSEPERDRYGYSIEYEDDERYHERLRETYDPNYELEEYEKNYKALEDITKENQKDKNIPKEKETEVEKDNEEKDFSL